MNLYAFTRVFIFISAIWVGYNTDARADYNACNAKTPVSLLGCGFLDNRILPLRCVDGRPRFVYLGRSGIEILNSYGNYDSSEYLQHQIDFRGEAWWGLVKAAYQAHGSKGSVDQQMTMSNVVEFYSTIGTFTLDNSHFASMPSSEESEKRLCGDKYVMQAKVGVTVSLVFKIRFKNKEKYEKFAANYEASALWGAIGKDGTIANDHIAELVSETEIGVEMTQIGGDQTILEQIYQSDEAILCRISRHISACHLLYERYIKYLRDELPHLLKIPTEAQLRDEFLSQLALQSIETGSNFRIFK